MNKLEHTLFTNGAEKCREGKGERKRKKRDDEDEDDDEMYHPSQDYYNDSQVDPEFRPT